MLETMPFTFYRGGRPITDEWEVKWNDSVLGLGHQQQVWVAWYGTSAIIPIIQLSV